MLQNSKTYVHNCSSEVPRQQKAPDHILSHVPVANMHPVRFRSNNGEIIRKTAMKTKGGFSPGWRRILVSNQFQVSNSDLLQGIRID